MVLDDSMKMACAHNGPIYVIYIPLIPVAVAIVCLFMPMCSEECTDTIRLIYYPSGLCEDLLYTTRGRRWGEEGEGSKRDDK